MGMAFKCDVCGNFYDYYQRKDDCSTVSMGQYDANAMMFMHINKYGAGIDNGFRTPIVLCPECMDAVVNKLIELKEKRGK